MAHSDASSGTSWIAHVPHKAPPPATLTQQIGATRDSKRRRVDQGDDDGIEREFWRFCQKWQTAASLEGALPDDLDPGIRKVVEVYKSRPFFEDTGGPSRLLATVEELNLDHGAKSRIGYAAGVGLSVSLITENADSFSSGLSDSQEQARVAEAIRKRSAEKKACWEARRRTAGESRLLAGLFSLRAEAGQQVAQALTETQTEQGQRKLFRVLQKIHAVGDYRAVRWAKFLRVFGLCGHNFTFVPLGPGSKKALGRFRKKYPTSIGGENDAALVARLVASQPAALGLRRADAVDVEHMLCYCHVWQKVHLRSSPAARGNANL